MNVEPSSEKAKNAAREFLKPDTCIHCAYQGYRLATFMWAVTQAKLCADEKDREARAWLDKMHASAIAALLRIDREALARLALEIVPEAEASLAVLRDNTSLGDLRDFMETMLEKLR